MTLSSPFEELSSEASLVDSGPDAKWVLDQVEPFRCRLYAEVRSILDSLEEATPWSELYYPPDDLAAFLSFEEGFLSVVDTAPGRLNGVIEELLAECPPPEGESEDETRSALEEAEFFFRGIEVMVNRDVQRLRQRLDGVQRFGAETAVSQRERVYLSELTSELKGKYSSALMGAAASLVGEGRWSGVEAEELLFPEKRAEHRRNRELLETLELVLQETRSIGERVELTKLRERWLAGERNDQYALTDLVAFRGVLGQLLKRRRRRALYSGDYHELQRRERRLMGLLSEMETLHQRTWSASGSSHLEAVCPRLGALCLEVGALVDVSLLKEMIGETLVADLRALVVLERERQKDSGSEALDESQRDALPREQRAVVAVLHDDDLMTFLQFLLGSVRKRSSFATVEGEKPQVSEGEALEAADLPPSVEPFQPSSELAPEPFLDSEVELLPGLELEPLPEAEPEPVLEMEMEMEMDPPPDTGPASLPNEETLELAPAMAKTHTLPTEPPLVASEERRIAVAEMHQLLVEVQSPRHPERRSLDLLKRLLAKHSRVPPSMLQGSNSYFFDLLNRLVPELERASGFGVVPAEARYQLVEYCTVLCRGDLTPSDMGGGGPASSGASGSVATGSDDDHGQLGTSALLTPGPRSRPRSGGSASHFLRAS